MGYNQAMLVGRAQDKAILNMIENKAIDLTYRLSQFMR